MANRFLLAAVTASLPVAAQAQGTIRGAAGPVGGGAVGAATGTVGGILGVDDRPRFRSYDYDGRVAVGSTLPSSGVTYYDVPNDYRVKPGYRYTVVNRQPVLVDGSHRIVEVLD